MDNQICYCKKCVLNSNIPGIKIEQDNQCNICKGENIKGSKNKIKGHMKTCKEFEKNLVTNNNVYDCLFLLSGGKDSLYALREMIERKEVNFLAFTLKHPYFTEDSISNIELIKEKYDFNHMYFNYQKDTYIKMYQKLFSNEKKWNEFDAQRLACHICVCLTIITATVFAYKMNIKYIMMCLDPEQIGVMNQNGRYYLDVFEEIIGIDFLYEIFGKDVIDDIKGLDESNLPVMFSPYAGMLKYDRKYIISKLKEWNIYQGNTGLHKCQLSPLLYYYSAKRYNSYYSIMRIANFVRKNNLEREKAITFLEKYQEFMEKTDFSKEITSDEEDNLKRIFEIIYSKDSKEEELIFEVNNTLNICKTLKEYNITIK